MKIDVDFRSDIPLYIQIVEQIQQRVAEGELKPGDQLPTVRALASELRVNFNTVARSYRLLDEAGVISTQQGRGTYILEMPLPEVTERLRSESLQALARRYLSEAKRLGYNAQGALEIFQKTAEAWQKNSGTKSKRKNKREDRMANKIERPDQIHQARSAHSANCRRDFHRLLDHRHPGQHLPGNAMYPTFPPAHG